MKKQPITAVIIAYNEAEMIAACLSTLEWCSEVLVIDNGSTDETVKIAEQMGARVITAKHASFAKLRNEALKHIENDWVLYIDADERVTPTLAKEILVHIETNSADVLVLQRSNIFFGMEFKHGGWEADSVQRVFRKKALKEWTGVVHETPHFEGTTQLLQAPLIHLTHRDVRSGLFKSASWTYREAELLYKGGVGRVSILTVLRKSTMEFLRRAFFKSGYKDGQAGMIEAFIQGVNKGLVYAQVWELQQDPAIAQNYKKEEEKIVALWKVEAHS